MVTISTSDQNAIIKFLRNELLKIFQGLCMMTLVTKMTHIYDQIKKYLLARNFALENIQTQWDFWVSSDSLRVKNQKSSKFFQKAYFAPVQKDAQVGSVFPNDVLHEMYWVRFRTKKFFLSTIHVWYISGSIISSTKWVKRLDKGSKTISKGLFGWCRTRNIGFRSME